MYQYKTVSVAQQLVCKRGLDLGETLAEYIQEQIEDMAEEGWEYYRADTFQVAETPGCLYSIFGGSVKAANFNVLIFRKDVE